MSAGVPFTTPPDDEPRDPIHAVRHADPYPYYARMTAEAPFAHHPSLGLWVASDAASVEAVLTSPICRVRPAAEPVPRALAGSPAGEVFGHLVRMNDGPIHDQRKRAVSEALDGLDPERVAARARRWGQTLASAIAPDDASALNELLFALPAHVIASLLGTPDDAVPAAAKMAGDLARAFAPAATKEHLAAGSAAASGLLDLVRSQRRSGDDDTLLGALAAQAGPSPDGDAAFAILANAVGFLTQAYEATAGLTALALVTLAALPDARARLREGRALIPFLAEVARYDSPVQNTRRFVAEDGEVSGCALKQGEAILVLLAAANRDPRANADPHHFDETRINRRLFTFGIGPHACPGESLATTIAACGIGALLDRGLDPGRLDPHPAFRPSANVRIPVLAMRGGKEDA